MFFKEICNEKTFGICLIIGGIGVVFLILSLLRVLKRKRKIAKNKIYREVQFTLPERENSFIRERLHTVLNEELSSFHTGTSGGKEIKRPINLNYAQEIVSKVLLAPLTVAERLQTEETSRLLALYVSKENWTAGDLRAVNELFSSLLKLSAKYAIQD